MAHLSVLSNLERAKKQARSNIQICDTLTSKEAGTSSEQNYEGTENGDLNAYT